jgi:hypothetical protein
MKRSRRNLALKRKALIGSILRYKEQSSATTMFCKDVEVEKAKVRTSEEQLKKIKFECPLSLHSKMETPKGYRFLELDNLQEEVRQLGITNDNLSTQLDEAVE